MSVHPNSAAAHKQLEHLEGDYRAIWLALQSVIDMTDREIWEFLNGRCNAKSFGDLKPRITELHADDWLKEGEPRRCRFTGRKVRTSVPVGAWERTERKASRERTRVDREAAARGGDEATAVAPLRFDLLSLCKSYMHGLDEEFNRQKSLLEQEIGRTL